MEGKGYRLYVGDNCCSCNNIEQFLNKNNITIPIINIDKEEYDLPFSLMIIPALVKNEKLIGYGPDIMKYLENRPV